MTACPQQAEGCTFRYRLATWRAGGKWIGSDRRAHERGTTRTDKQKRRPLGIRSGRWKLIQSARKTKIDDDEKYAVFDMENGWQESVNLIRSQPETFERLKSLVAKQKADGRIIWHGRSSKPTDSQ